MDKRCEAEQILIELLIGAETRGFKVGLIIGSSSVFLGFITFLIFR